MLLSFDLDGNLIDSEYALSMEVAKIAAAEGLSVAGEDIFRVYSGMGSRDKFAAMGARAGRKFGEDDLKRLSLAHKNAKARIYQKPEALRVFDHVRDALNGLYAQGHVFCVCSNNSSKELAIDAIDRAGLSHYFKGRVYTDADVGGRKKPDLAMILHAMAQNDFTAAQTVHIDDSAAGLSAGRNAGVKTIAFLNPRYGDFMLSQLDRLNQAGATSAFSDYRALNSIIIQSAPPARPGPAP